MSVDVDTGEERVKRKGLCDVWSRDFELVTKDEQPSRGGEVLGWNVCP